MHFNLGSNGLKGLTGKVYSDLLVMLCRYTIM